MQAEVPRLPVSSFVDFKTIFKQLPLPDASERGAKLVSAVWAKTDLMRSREHLNAVFDGPPAPGAVVSSTLKMYYDPLRTGAVPPPELDEGAEVPFAAGEVLCGRYELLELCGQATFSNCFAALDRRSGARICLKIIKNDKEFFDQALDEIHLLQLVRELDPR